MDFHDMFNYDWDNKENSHSPEQRKKFLLRITILCALILVVLMVYLYLDS